MSARGYRILISTPNAYSIDVTWETEEELLEMMSLFVTETENSGGISETIEAVKTQLINHPGWIPQ